MSFMEIFQPGLKHLREERQRQQHDIAYPTDGADPLVDINLDAGTATIVIPARAGHPSARPSEPELAIPTEPSTDEPDSLPASADLRDVGPAERPGHGHEQRPGQRTSSEPA